MVSDQFARPEVVWNFTSASLIDDILHKQRRVLGAPGLFHCLFIIFKYIRIIFVRSFFSKKISFLTVRAFVFK